MRAHEVLGVEPVATPAEVRAAHRRLGRLVDPRNGGSRALVEIVDDAYRALSRGADVAIDAREPRRVLGLDDDDDVSRGDARAAYRRLAARVHPDAGGSDELFRIVGGAYEAIARPPRLRPGRSWATWPTWSPRPDTEPARRRVERPYKAPPEDARFHAPGWRDWASVAAHTAVLAFWMAMAALVVVAVDNARGEGRLTLALLVPAWAISFWMQGRVTLSGLFRAFARSRASWARQRGVDPEAFLADRCLDSPVHREREDLLYDAYAGWCRERRARPLSRWVFIEKLRTLGLLHVQPSTLDPGLFVGVRLR